MLRVCLLVLLLTLPEFGDSLQITECHASEFGTSLQITDSQPPEFGGTEFGDSLTIAEWHYLGPFSIGPREGVIGITDEPGALEPCDGDRYISTLTQGGIVSWKQAAPDSTGWVEIGFENVLWDTLMDIYGYAGIVNGAYAYSEFMVPAERHALVIAERIGSFYLNGDLHNGDPYGHDFMRIPVVLREGINRVVLNLSGYADHRFRFEIVPPPAPVITLEDFTVPDIREGEKGLFWIGVPLLNTTSERFHEVVVSIGDGRSVDLTHHTVRNLAPLCVKKVPLEIQVADVPSATEEITIPVEVTCQGTCYTDSVTLRIRGSDQSYKRTFISSIDSSCQYYAVLPPEDYDPAETYALIFTTHGAGVKAEGQVDAYKPKSWAFVVAPTNRRPFGFDWQDWGRLDALEVLEIAEATLPIEPNRIYLTGHSMGGHGAWHIGLTHPDRFAAMAPAAGWTSFELYVPWFLQKARIFGEPGQCAIRDMSLRQDQPHNFVENALNLPVFILQGGADDNVPPVHARLFARRLDELGYRYRYKEDPGRGHWYSIDSLDVSCVDDPDLMGYFTGKARNPFPHHVVFKTTNVGHSNSAYWLKIKRQEKCYHESRIEGHVAGDTVTVTTANVDEFEVSLSEYLLPTDRVTLSVDGKSRHLDLNAGRSITLSKRAGEFRLGGLAPGGLAKRPELHGPIKQAYFSPFVLVYGTRGDSITTDLLLHQARLEAFEWWRRGNGFAEVLPDTEVTAGIIDKFNLMLFGGPGENHITSRIDRFLPIRLDEGSFFLGGKRLEGECLAAKFIYPNPLNEERLVVVHEGLGVDGLRLSTFFRTIYAGAGLPDFMIFDKSVTRKGWGGMISTGFFDSSWQLDPGLMYERTGHE
ncbi:MAG: prolyl oligopeptidase family serine peptidase [Candidatus Eisenbacteria bacterium]